MLTVESSRQDALAFAAAALDEAKVPYFAVPAYAGDRYRLGVLEQHRPATEQALTGAVGDSWRLRPLATETDGWVLFRPQTWERSSFRLGPESGVLVEVWDVTAAGWVARVNNPVCCLIPPGGQEGATVEIGGRRYPTVRALTGTPWDDVTFPIDAVYTWVDSRDPEWVGARDRRRAELGTALDPSATAPARFTDRDELRYSLRSLEQFLPWVRTVFLVTAGHRPAWLVDEHPRLRVVEHREILPADALPTFNSMAIETALHHIDGLADHYLYFNDDVFAGRPLVPRDFFLSNGATKFFLRPRAELDAGPPVDGEDLVVRVTKNARDMLDGLFGRRITKLLMHTPHAQRRDVLAEMEERFPSEVRATQCSPFRDPADVPFAPTLYPYYAFFTGRALPGRLRYRGVSLGRPDLPEVLRQVARQQPQTFCLNDADVPSEAEADRDRVVRRFLRRYFPEPSSFERG